jgi:hypothetical protein
MENNLSFNSGAVYSIQLQGFLDQNWANQFGSLKVLTFQSNDPQRPPVTTVIGEVVDQAALAGFLNFVYDLGIPLLSVTYLGDA